MTKEEVLRCIATEDEGEIEALFENARAVRERHYRKEVYFRGLIEFSNYCKNDCYYCGLRKSNAALKRYRLTKNEILDCCRLGAELGYKTFVLQSGEDGYFSVAMIADIVSAIKKAFPENAVTLSLGEHPIAAYEAWFDAGADRYLLRHETANEAHYAKLHPSNMSGANRKRCLHELKKIGYAAGAGFMVGVNNQ